MYMYTLKTTADSQKVFFPAEIAKYSTVKMAAFWTDFVHSVQCDFLLFSYQSLITYKRVIY